MRSHCLPGKPGLLGELETGNGIRGSLRRRGVIALGRPGMDGRKLAMRIRLETR